LPLLSLTSVPRPPSMKSGVGASSWPSLPPSRN